MSEWMTKEDWRALRMSAYASENELARRQDKRIAYTIRTLARSCLRLERERDLARRDAQSYHAWPTNSEQAGIKKLVEQRDHITTLEADNATLAADAAIMRDLLREIVAQVESCDPADEFVSQPVSVFRRWYETAKRMLLPGDERKKDPYYCEHSDTEPAHRCRDCGSYF